MGFDIRPGVTPRPECCLAGFCAPPQRGVTPESGHRFEDAGSCPAVVVFGPWMRMAGRLSEPYARFTNLDISLMIKIGIIVWGA